MPDEARLGLGRSVDAVVHELACQHLEQARAALIRAELETDAKALHDFRVATRRLRSLLEAYCEALQTSRRWVKPLERLRTLSSLTGRARDAEAQLEWIKKHTSDEHHAVSVAREALDEKLEGVRQSGYRRARERAVPEFFAMRVELVGAGLGHPPAANETLHPEETFAHTCATQLDQLIERLQARLRDEHRLEDESGSHDTRIEAKRLRYLLEPLRDALGESRAAVKRLRRLQNALGELNDLRGLRALLRATFERAVLESAQARWASAQSDLQEPAERAVLLEEGCLELSRSVEERRRALSEALGRDWFGGQSEEFFAQLCEISRELREHALGRPTAPELETENETDPEPVPTPAAAPHAQGGSGFAAPAPAASASQLRAAARRAVHGLRAARGPQGARYYRTVKQDFGGQEIEFEKVISRSEFDRLKSEGEGGQVRVQHRVRAPIHELLRMPGQEPTRAAPARDENGGLTALEERDAPPTAQPTPTPAPQQRPAAPEPPRLALRPSLPPATPPPALRIPSAPIPALSGATLGGGLEAAIRPVTGLGELGAAGRALVDGALSRIRTALALARARGRSASVPEQLAGLGAVLLLTLTGGMVMPLAIERLGGSEAPVGGASAAVFPSQRAAARIEVEEVSFSAVARAPTRAAQVLGIRRAAAGPIESGL